MRIALWFAVSTLAVVGCSTNSKSVPDDMKQQSAPQATKEASDTKREYGSSAMSGQAAEPASGGSTAPKGPADMMSQGANSGSSAPASGGGSAAGLGFAVPAGWTQTTPSSQMRVAQFALPAAGGEAPELVLFFFGAGQGGGVQDNIARWVGQVAQPDGSDSSSKAKSGSKQVGALKMTTVVVDGTYKSGGMMGGPTVMKENFRLWGAVVEGPGGPWFWKATGPKAAMESQAAAFDAFLASMHAQ